MKILFSTRGGGEKCIQNFGWKSGRENVLGHPGIDGRVILKQILKEIDCRLDLSDSRVDQLVASCEHDNEPLDFMKLVQ